MGENCDDDKIVMVPYIVYEAEMTRLERIIKRLWILCIIIFLAFVISNGAWIWYENQWEEVTVTQDVETGKGDALVTGTGDISYGTNKADSNNP